MNPWNLFVIVQRQERPRVRGASTDIGGLLLGAVVVHGFLLLVSWALFLNAPLNVRILIVVLWACYIGLVSWFIAALTADARASTRVPPHRPEPIAAESPPQPIERKPCLGPLDGGRSPCPKDALIPIDATRCAYCERLRPSRP